MTAIRTPRMTLQACSIPHFEELIKGHQSYEATFGVKVMDGYIEFPDALNYMLSQLKSAGVDLTWGAYLYIHRADNALIGMGGYKGAPDTQGMVEIGYGVAPAYRGQGYATEAARGLTDAAFQDERVGKVWAHTLAEINASAQVLTKCGLTKIGELDDPDDGRIWRWEITKDRWLKIKQFR